MEDLILQILLMLDKTKSRPSPLNRSHNFEPNIIYCGDDFCLQTNLGSFSHPSPPNHFTVS